MDKEKLAKAKRKLEKLLAKAENEREEQGTEEDAGIDKKPGSLPEMDFKKFLGCGG